jgi:hypothetical protein
VLFYVVLVCKCVLPPGDNPIAVNKYIISYYIVSNGGLIVKNEFGRMWKEGVVTYLRYSGVSLYVRGKPQETSVMMPASGPRLEARPTGIRRTRATQCAAVI